MPANGRLLDAFSRRPIPVDEAADRDRMSLPGSIPPEVIGSVFEDDINAVLTVAIVDQALNHTVIFRLLLFIPRTRFGDDAGEFAHRIHQLLFNSVG